MSLHIKIVLLNQVWPFINVKKPNLSRFGLYNSTDLRRKKSRLTKMDSLFL